MLVKARLKIVGIDCAACVYAIKRSVEGLSCVKAINIDVTGGDAIVEYDDSTCSLRDIYKKIVESGYDVIKEKVYLDLKEVSDEHIAFLERKILGEKGVLDVRISSATKVATVLYNPLETDAESLGRGLAAIGVRGLAGKVERKPSLLERTLLYRRLTSFTIGFLAVLLSMYEMISGHRLVIYEDLTLFVMALFAILLNYDIIFRGARALKLLAPTMDSLISLSSLSTILFGTLIALGVLEFHGSLHSHSFYEASAGVIGLVGLGKYLEERLRRRSFKALEDLATSIKRSAKVLVETGVVVEKPISDIRPGDIVEVKAGEIIPVDGVVVEGEGHVDESSFTGEPLPRHKRSGTRDPVLAGSMLVSGYLRIRVTRVGDDTLLAQIVETVRGAESLKPQLARWADRVVGYFTWIVMIVAGATFAFWWIVLDSLQKAVTFMAAVLVVACPCALGIAIPLVISIAVLKSSRSGVLIRSSDIFERIRETNVIVFDKTGTLTIGKQALIAVHTLKDGFREKEVLGLVCSVESRSEHPIARAILEACSSNGIGYNDPEEFVHIPGEGIYGVLNGVSIAAGNLDLMLRVGASVGDEVLSLMREVGSRGRTPVIVAINSEIVAVLELGDRPRDEAPQVIGELKKLGFKVGLASGDIEPSVSYYKKLLGLDFAFWGLKPEDKAELVKDLQNKGYRVMFVGDGLNDAPALATANIGVAMGRGADVSKEAGDVVLLNNNLGSLPFLIKFSKLARRKMKQNIAWAFIYNMTLIPIAMGVLYPHLFLTPEMAAAAMVLSDISVILNALSVLNYKPTSTKAPADVHFP